MARLLALAMLFFFLWHFFWRVYSALFLALLAVLIAIILHAPAKWLSRWIPFRVAFALVVVLSLAMIAGLLTALIPQLVDQATQLATQFPATIEHAVSWYQARKGGTPDPRLADTLTRQMAEFAGRFVPLAFNVIGAALGAFALVVLAVFLAAEPELYRRLALELIPAESRPKWEAVYDEVGESLRAWVIGKALTMLGIGVATWIGLVLFGVPGALALAAVAALMEFIPSIGPTIAAIPAVIAAFSVSPATAVWVAVFYFALQQVQNAITVPLVERRAVNIPPAVLLVWQLMLAVGFGILALFVATPLLAVLWVVIRVVWVEPSAERSAWDRREHAPAAGPARGEGPPDA